jgi:hypothetical protein
MLHLWPKAFTVRLRGDRMVRKWIIAYCGLAILLSIGTALLLYYIT